MQEKIYFPGLNGLRFLAAVSVILWHVEEFKQLFGFVGSRQMFFLARWLPTGTEAVILFFVLSGFLITYLLLSEHKSTGQIAVRKFYIRRILRIWPIYYLMVFVGFVAVPAIYHASGFQGFYVPVGENFVPKLLEYIFFLPNLELVTLGMVLGISQFWSIGVEEQFYLVWPVLMRKFIKHLPACFFGIIAFKALCYGLHLLFVHQQVPPAFDFLEPFVKFVVSYFQIESMAIGGIGAYLVFNNRQRILRIVFHPIVEKLTLILAVYTTFFFHYTEPFLSIVALSTLYLSLVLNVACNPRSTLKLESKFWNQLGKYSYGIYVYHTVVIYLVLIAFSSVNFTGVRAAVYNLILYSLVIGLTIFIAAVSYEKFEIRFLRLKARVQVIKSGDDAQTAPQGTSGADGQAAIILEASK